MTRKPLNKTNQKGNVLTEFMVIAVFMVLAIWLAVPELAEAIADREDSYTRAISIPL